MFLPIVAGLVTLTVEDSDGLGFADGGFAFDVAVFAVAPGFAFGFVALVAAVLVLPDVAVFEMAGVADFVFAAEAAFDKGFRSFGGTFGNLLAPLLAPDETLSSSELWTSSADLTLGLFVFVTCFFRTGFPPSLSLVLAAVSRSFRFLSFASSARRAFFGSLANNVFDNAPVDGLGVDDGPSRGVFEALTPPFSVDSPPAIGLAP